jgi:hypothetical protein
LYFADTISFHFSIKCDAISTAIGISPPPFHLRSNIIQSTQADLRLFISLLNIFSVSSPIINISIYHIFFDSIELSLFSISNTSLVTDGTLILSLTTSIPIISLQSISFQLDHVNPTFDFRLYLSIVIFTLVHAGHFILFTASSIVSSFTYPLSILITRSNGFIQALKAGDHFNTSSICT